MSISEQLALPLGLVQNVALLALGVQGACQVREWMQGRVSAAWQELLFGLLLGGIGIVGMLASIDAGAGVHIDLRNAVVVVATIFGGAAGGAVSLVAIGLYRFSLGGGGMAGGIITLTVTYGVCLADLMIVRDLRNRTGVLNLVAVAAVTALTGLIVFVLPSQPSSSLALMHVIAPFWVTALIAAAIFLGAIVRHYESSQRLLRSLQESEERFRALIEHSSDSVSVVTPSGAVKYRNRMGCDMLGKTNDEMMRGSLLDFAHPDEVEALRQSWAGVAEKPDGHALGRNRFQHSDGSWRLIAWSARNARTVPGVEGLIVTARDDTEANRLEEQLRQAQKMEAVGRLAGGIAHDFNNLLGGILGFTGFLLDDLPPESQEHGFAARIKTASERARDLVQQILAFSRLTSVERAPTDLVRILQETKALLRASLPSSTELDIAVQPEMLIAKVNKGQISQILLNLCLNANDALGGEPGSITLELVRVAQGDRDYAHLSDIGGQQGRLVAGVLDSTRSYARIRVRDTGCGMDDATLKRIFDPFYTTKPTGQGTGLGLSVVHGIVMAYEGACVVGSRLGEGSAFTIYLPAEEAEAISAGTEENRPVRRGSGRILVVDDELMISDVLKIGLVRLGYEVETTNDAHTALSRFERDPESWDLVISDQVMPGMKGLRLFERMTRVRPSLPFILCSGFSDGATEERAQKLGIDAFFVKPVAFEQLEAAIRRLMPKDGLVSAEGTDPQSEVRRRRFSWGRGGAGPSE